MMRPPLSYFAQIGLLITDHVRVVIVLISNSNWTEWTATKGVIGRIISKLAEREARGSFEITSTSTPELYDTGSNY